MTPMALFHEFQLPVMQAWREKRGADPATLKAAVKDERVRARIVMREAVEARLVRAIEGPRQLQEVMTAFWFNHFNVFAAKGLDTIWTGSFEETAIRPHTLGKFRALLGATAIHPAMLFYLDNWQNSAPHGVDSKGKFEGINENYARELMELHTMGVNGGYTQQDVYSVRAYPDRLGPPQGPWRTVWRADVAVWAGALRTVSATASSALVRPRDAGGPERLLPRCEPPRLWPENVSRPPYRRLWNPRR